MWGGGLNIHSPCASAGLKPRVISTCFVAPCLLYLPDLEVRAISLLAQSWKAMSLPVCAKEGRFLGKWAQAGSFLRRARISASEKGVLGLLDQVGAPESRFTSPGLKG